MQPLENRKSPLQFLEEGITDYFDLPRVGVKVSISGDRQAKITEAIKRHGINTGDVEGMKSTFTLLHSLTDNQV